MEVLKLFCNEWWPIKQSVLNLSLVSIKLNILHLRNIAINRNVGEQLIFTHVVCIAFATVLCDLSTHDYTDALVLTLTGPSKRDIDHL